MTITAGNAYEDGPRHRGWLVGHFVEPRDSHMNSTDVEVKWFMHPAGEEREGWTVGEEEVRTTLVLLISGQFVVQLPGQDVEMKRSGDYANFGPGTAHSWRAVEDSVVVTVRWPSVA